MMDPQALEIPLPEGVHPSQDERALLEALCRMVLSVRGEGGPPWHAAAQRLEAGGWALHCGLAGWRRAGGGEQGYGRTLDEAFGELEQCAMLVELEGCP